jgi:hypothetical protein
VTIVIEKNIPRPEVKAQNLAADKAREMAVDDSALCDTAKEAKSLAQALRNQGFRQLTRKESDGKYRVWKVAALGS